MSQGAEHSPPAISGPPQYAVRSRNEPSSEVWFTIGQGWEFQTDRGPAYQLQFTMTPVNWNGELLLMPIPGQEKGPASGQASAASEGNR
ncbi:hypothetical protein ABZT51_28340 [Streptomyces sp. NPDC005373]|uniref:hypothetical protein n=1 Tax=unclassified Streptomyces TaxID=2593676 RepID=UPI0033A04835